MSFKKLLFLTLGMALGASLANAGIAFTCAATVDATAAGTCAYLNSTVAGLYGSTFTNANANIYIQMGITGLGSSTTGYYNDVSYATYLADLTATASHNAVDTAALAALNTYDTPAYSKNNVVITSALGEALGISDASLVGTTSGGSACIIGTAGCYNGIITITTPANLSTETSGTQTLYWNQLGGAQPSNSYDFYSVVEHETDEILGTASCIDTQGPSLTNDCNVIGAGDPSAVDLFRYSSAGNLVLDSSLSTTPGAYFSYNGGTSNGADGADYNTLSNGNDYADFTTNCLHVQDAEGCLGKQFDITTDGGSEINILDAIGYNLAATSAPVPEPSSVLLFGSMLAITGFFIRKRIAVRKSEG